MASRSSLAACLSVSCFAFAACGEAPPGDANAVYFDPCQPVAVVVDAGVTSAESTGVSAALALWNQAAAAHLTAGAGDAAMPALPVRFQAAAAPFHGFYDSSARVVYINVDLVDHEQAVTIAHEIGHAFGLVHVSPGERASVMNPGNLSVEPTAADSAALQAIWGICP